MILPTTNRNKMFCLIAVVPNRMSLKKNIGVKVHRNSRKYRPELEKLKNPCPYVHRLFIKLALLFHLNICWQNFVIACIIAFNLIIFVL